MPKLKIDNVEDEKPVTLSIKLPAGIHRDLVAYAELLNREGGQSTDPKSLVAPMLKRFMATDRVFAKSRRALRREKGCMKSVPDQALELVSAVERFLATVRAA